MVSESDSEITSEQWHRQKRVDVIIHKRVIKVIQGSQDCTPSNERVDSVDDEDSHSISCILFHKEIYHRQNMQNSYINEKLIILFFGQ